MGFKSNFCSLFIYINLINLCSSWDKFEAINRCHFTLVDMFITKSFHLRCVCGIDRENEIFEDPKKVKASLFLFQFNILEEDEYDSGGFDAISFENCRFTTLKRNIFEVFYRLRTVNISNVDLETLHVNIFREARNLTEVDISKNRLKEIPGHIFSEAVKLKDVDFSDNCIIRVHPLAFEGATELQKLNLSFNQLTDLDVRIFPLPKLLILDLSNNNITKLNENIFDKLTSLKTLKLSFNVLETLHTNIFANLLDLEELSLKHTNLSNILPGTFLHQSKLILLDLSDNNLKRFDHTLFHPNLLNLQSLRLSKNQLSDVNGLQSTFFPQMTLFDIAGNPFICSYLLHTIELLSTQWENIRFNNETTFIDRDKSYIRGVNCNHRPAEKTTSDHRSTTNADIATQKALTIAKN